MNKDTDDEDPDFDLHGWLVKTLLEGKSHCNLTVFCLLRNNPVCFNTGDVSQT